MQGENVRFEGGSYSVLQWVHSYWLLLVTSLSPFLANEHAALFYYSNV